MKPVEQRIEQLERDRRAVTVGTAVTTVATIAFFVAPEVVDAVATSRSLPVDLLRWGGGATGGGVAGWLASEQGSGLIIGMKVAIYGLFIAYAVAVVLYLGYGAAVGAFPPPGLALVAVLLYYLIPLLLSHLLGGLIAGTALHRVGSRE
jgi:hypothetical protein